MPLEMKEKLENPIKGRKVMEKVILKWAKYTKRKRVDGAQGTGA